MEKNDRNDKNIGKKLDGRYEIIERIGEGGMADVYRATDVVDKKTVAVKILKREFAENEEFLRRFRNESKAIAVLSHPNIVKVFDVGFSDRIQFIVMEYIDGNTLNEYMELQGQLDWRDAVHYILQILRALQHAHSKGIVHRDIKPQNIMMLPDGTIKVMDFGIAKFAREEGKTQTDKAIGTVHYISPEQARGAATDAKSDLYSVGVMFYEMLTGKKPFDTDNPVSIAVMHMQAEVPQPHTIRPDIQVGLEEIILKAMQKDPKDRYQTARDMMDDIETFKENQDVLFGYFPELEKRAGRSVETILAGGSSDSDKTKTRAYTPVNEPEEPAEAPEDYEEEDYEDDEDEYEEEERKSLFVPIFSAVIIVVIVVAAIMFSSMILDALDRTRTGVTVEEMAMPNLIGMDYQEANMQYSEYIQIVVDSTEYSDFEKDKIFDQDIPEGNAVKKGEKVKVKVSLGARKVQISDFTNWDYETAKQQIQSLGINIDPRYSYNDEVEAGKIISTDPQGPVDVDPNSYLIVTISRGQNKRTVPVPNFVGHNWEVALTEAESLGLLLEKKSVTDITEEGTILSQDIKANEEVSENTVITLEVSTGVPEPKDVDIAFTIPGDAAGRFHITVYEDGIVTLDASPFDVEYASGRTKVTVSGNGTADLILTLTNDATGAKARIGSFRVNFDTGSVTTLSADIGKAFHDVGGIAVVTTDSTAATHAETTTAKTWAPPVSTETTTVATTETPPEPSTEAPAE